jgi:hypothetical protein
MKSVKRVFFGAKSIPGMSRNLGRGIRSKRYPFALNLSAITQGSSSQASTPSVISIIIFLESAFGKSPAAASNDLAILELFLSLAKL